MNTRIIPTLREILENLNIIEEILNETSLGTISFSFFLFYFLYTSAWAQWCTQVAQLIEVGEKLVALQWEQKAEVSHLARNHPYVPRYKVQ